MADLPSNADAIADAKISPGDDYEEIREQVRSKINKQSCLYILSTTIIFVMSLTTSTRGALVWGVQVQSRRRLYITLEGWLLLPKL